MPSAPKWSPSVRADDDDVLALQGWKGFAWTEGHRAASARCAAPSSLQMAGRARAKFCACHLCRRAFRGRTEPGFDRRPVYSTRSACRVLPVRVLLRRSCQVHCHGRDTMRGSFAVGWLPLLWVARARAFVAAFFRAEPAVTNTRVGRDGGWSAGRLFHLLSRDVKAEVRWTGRLKAVTSCQSSS